MWANSHSIINLLLYIYMYILLILFLWTILTRNTHITYLGVEFFIFTLNWILWAFGSGSGSVVLCCHWFFKNFGHCYFKNISVLFLLCSPSYIPITHMLYLLKFPSSPQIFYSPHFLFFFFPFNLKNQKYKQKQFTSFSQPHSYLWQPQICTFDVYKCFSFWPHCMAHGNLVLQPGIELVPLQWKLRVLTTGPQGKSLYKLIFKYFIQI